MSGIEFTAALARVLGNRALRQRFIASPQETAAQLQVAEADRAAFCNLEPGAVMAQAETLLRKRQHEVAALLPVTFQLLGDTAGELFADFADAFWPTGASRHHDDALAFLRFLRKQGIIVCGVEANRLEHAASGRWLSIKLPRTVTSAGAPLRSIQILWGSRRRTRCLLVYLALNRA